MQITKAFVGPKSVGSDHTFRFSTYPVHIFMRYKVSKSWDPNRIKHHRRFVSSG